MQEWLQIQRRFTYMMKPLGLKEVARLEESPVNILSSRGDKVPELLRDDGSSGFPRERRLRGELSLHLRITSKRCG